MIHPILVAGAGPVRQRWIDGFCEELVRAIDDLISAVCHAPVDSDIRPLGEAAGHRIIDMSHAILRREWQRVQRGR